MTYKFLRARDVQKETGLPRSSLYHAISEGLLPPPVRLGARAVAWPAFEICLVNIARINGKTDDEVRALVLRLVSERKHLASETGLEDWRHGRN